MTKPRNRTGRRGTESRRDQAGRKEGRERPVAPKPQVVSAPAPTTAPRPWTAWWRWAPWLLVLAASLASYMNILGNELVSDAKLLILNNEALLNSREWLPWFLRDYYWGSDLADTTLYRPLTILSFLATIRVAGPNPFWFNLGNFLLHAAVSLLVLALGRHLVGSMAALAGALLFAVHPLHTEAVAWVAGRAELLAALFALLTSLAFLHATDSATRHAVPFGIATGLSFFAALLSKEHVITLPVWLVLVWMFDRKTRSFGRGALTMGGLAVAIAAFLLLRSLALQRPPMPIEELFNPLVGVSLFQRWLTAAAVIWRYATLFVWPGTLSISYSYAQIVPSRSMGIPEASGLLLVLGLAAAIVLTARRFPGLSLSMAFAPVTFLVVSNFPFPIATIMAERLTYLPSVGLCLAAGWLAERSAGGACGSTPAKSGHRQPIGSWWRPWAVGGLTLAILLALGTRTVVRNRDWRDEYSILTKGLAASPRSAHVMTAVAAMEKSRKNYPRAAALFKEAIGIFPRYLSARMNLGDIAALHLNDWQLAEDQYRAVTTMFPRYPDAHYNLGSLLARTGRIGEAEQEFRTATAYDPKLSEAHLALANLLLETGRSAEAIERYRIAARLNAKDGRPLFGLARASLVLGKKDEARRYAQQAAGVGFEIPGEFWQALGGAR